MIILKMVKDQYELGDDYGIQQLWSRLALVTNTIDISIVIKPPSIPNIHLKLPPATTTIPIIANRSRKKLWNLPLGCVSRSVAKNHIRIKSFVYKQHRDNTMGMMYSRSMSVV